MDQFKSATVVSKPNLALPLQCESFSCEATQKRKQIEGKEAKNILELKVSRIWRYLFNVSLSLVRPPRRESK
jgi:hypothetical protein